jgi:hypothetical protein
MAFLLHSNSFLIIGLSIAAFWSAHRLGPRNRAGVPLGSEMRQGGFGFFAVLIRASVLPLPAAPPALMARVFEDGLPDPH